MGGGGGPAPVLQPVGRGHAVPYRVSEDTKPESLVLMINFFDYLRRIAPSGVR